MRKRKLDLSDFKISFLAYKEMEYFCRRYKEKKYLAERNDEFSEKYRKDIELIEKTAAETDRELYNFILLNVTDGVAYEFFDASKRPCGRRQFYEERNFLQGFTEKLIVVKRELRCTGVLFLYYFFNYKEELL